MVSSSSDQSILPTPYMVSNNLKIHAPHHALGRRKTALGVPQSPPTRHTMYAVILHHLGHSIILFITCARTCWIALNWHSIYALINCIHPPKKVAPPPKAAHAPFGRIIPVYASHSFPHFCKLELLKWEKFKPMDYMLVKLHKSI